MNDKPKPVCNCTPEGDSARERRPTLHQEHCVILKWWNENNDPAARRHGLSPMTADTITETEIKEEIAQLDTEIAILQAALKIQRGPLVAQMRERAAEIINTRRGR